FLFIPRWGVVGAAWAQTCAFALYFGVSVFLAQRLVGLKFNWPPLLKLGVATTAVLFCAWWMQPAGKWNYVTRFGLFLCYPLVIWAWGVFSLEERHTLRRKWNLGIQSFYFQLRRTIEMTSTPTSRKDEARDNSELC